MEWNRCYNCRRKTCVHVIGVHVIGVCNYGRIREVACIMMWQQPLVVPCIPQLTKHNNVPTNSLHQWYHIPCDWSRTIFFAQGEMKNDPLKIMFSPNSIFIGFPFYAVIVIVRVKSEKLKESQSRLLSCVPLRPRYGTSKRLKFQNDEYYR